MKGISLLDGVIISRTTFEEFCIMNEYLLQENDYNYNQYKGKLSELDKIKIITKNIEK